eukprot:5840003-Pyramimonas_sp.AAC.1
MHAPPRVGCENAPWRAGAPGASSSGRALGQPSASPDETDAPGASSSGPALGQPSAAPPSAPPLVAAAQPTTAKEDNNKLWSLIGEITLKYLGGVLESTSGGAPVAATPGIDNLRSLVDCFTRDTGYGPIVEDSFCSLATGRTLAIQDPATVDDDWRVPHGFTIPEPGSTDLDRVRSAEITPPKELERVSVQLKRRKNVRDPQCLVQGFLDEDFVMAEALTVPFTQTVLVSDSTLTMNLPRDPVARIAMLEKTAGRELIASTVAGGVFLNELLGLVALARLRLAGADERFASVGDLPVPERGADLWQVNVCTATEGRARSVQTLQDQEALVELALGATRADPEAGMSTLA